MIVLELLFKNMMYVPLYIKSSFNSYAKSQFWGLDDTMSVTNRFGLPFLTQLTVILCPNHIDLLHHILFVFLYT